MRTCSFHWRSRWQRPAGRALLLGLLAVATAGCSTFGRKAADNLVTARQFSLQGVEAMQNGRLKEAESCFSQAVATCPADERAQRQLAEVLWQRGSQEQAVHHMQEAARLSGGDAGVLIRLGEMYLARGDLVRAGDKAEEAIQINRAAAAAWALKGHVLRQQGQRIEALAAYHRAISHQQHYPEVQFSVAEIYSQMNRPQRTLSTLESLADQYAPGQQPQQVLLMEGVAMKALGRHHDAAEMLASAARRGPASPDLLYHLAEAQMLAGDPTNARLSLSQALALSPRHVRSLQLQSRLDAGQHTMSALAERPFTPPN